MTKKELKEIGEATFRHIYSFSKKDYKFVDWDIFIDEDFNEWRVRCVVISKRHVVYRCVCWINEQGNLNNETCDCLG